MVAQREAPRRMSVAQWRHLLQTSEIKYEYRDGWVYAMTGASLAHSRIAVNLVRALEDALGTRPCWVYNSDAAARLSPSRYTFPDATVTCDERDRPATARAEVEAPCVIVEVLSDSTERDDRTAKFAAARACPSVQEYVLVVTEYQSVEVYRRAGPRWTYQEYGPGDSLELESIGAHLSVDQLYRLTDVPAGAGRPL